MTTHCSMQVAVLLILLCLIARCQGFLYIGNETYPSLPALFGRYMADGKLYQARIQYFHENPSLCDIDEKTRNSFVIPEGVETTASDLTLPVLPVGILVSRGNCPFQQKAIVAESLHPSVEFLLVANYKLSADDDEDTLVPMYSDGFSRLILLSITHRTGQSLKQLIASQDDVTKVAGGPILRLDSQPPSGYVTANVQSMILSAMGLFFMLLSFAGCIVILAGTFTQLSNGGSPMIRRSVLTMAEFEQLEVASSGECAICLDSIEEDSGNGLPCGHVYHKECLVPWLTERQAKCPLCKLDLLDHYEQQQQQEHGGRPLRRWFRWPYTQVEQQEVEMQEINEESAQSTT